MWFYDYESDIDYVAEVNDALLIKNSADAARYKKTDRAIGLEIGKRAIIKNKKGNFAVVTLVKIDSEVVTFEYEILQS